MPIERLENTPDIPRRIFGEAMYDTVATMAGICLDITAETMEKGMRFDCDDITGVMMLAGNTKAVLLITTNKDSALELVSYMTGMEGNELTDDDLFDGVMELVNMVAGIARTKLMDTPYAFHLSSPFALTGEQVGIIIKRSVSGYLAKFNAGNVHLKMKVIYV